VKRPDLLLLVAIWQFVSVFFAAICIVAIAVFAFPVVLDLWGDALIGGVFGLSIALLLFAAIIVVGLAAGIGLLQGREWARILAIVQAVLTVLWVPIGTIIGVLVLVYLTRPEIVAYFKRPAE
jgi:hypothetical protein